MQIVDYSSNEKDALIRISETVERLVMEKQKL